MATFPHGDSHLLGSGLQNAPVTVDHALQVQLPLLTRMRYGGDGNLALVICGWFAYERDIPNPLIDSLPRMFCASVGRRPSGPWIAQSIRYALDEGDVPHPGSTLVRAKVAEMLFVEALRGYIEALPPSQTGWLPGLRDPQIGKCLALMHSDPAHAWSVAELAHEVHMSRSVLAERFTQLVNIPPMHYLKRWRLAMAARLLCNELSNLAQIAETIGYESETAFSRAFKHEYGIAPASGAVAPCPTMALPCNLIFQEPPTSGRRCRHAGSTGPSTREARWLRQVALITRSSAGVPSGEPSRRLP